MPSKFCLEKVRLKAVFDAFYTRERGTSFECGSPNHRPSPSGLGGLRGHSENNTPEDNKERTQRNEG